MISHALVAPLLGILLFAAGEAQSQQCRLGKSYFSGDLCDEVSVIPDGHDLTELQFEVFATKERYFACDSISALSIEKSTIFAGVDISNLDDSDLPFVFQQELLRNKHVPNSILASIDILLNITGTFTAEGLAEGRIAVGVVPFFGRMHHFPLSYDAATESLYFSASLLGNIHELCKPDGIYILVFSLLDGEENITSAGDPRLISWSHISQEKLDSTLSRHSLYRNRSTDLRKD